MNKLSGFLELLIKGPFKILSQNGKLMAFTAAFYLILYSISFILYTFSSKPFIIDFTLKLFAIFYAHPGTPEYTALLVAIREDVGIFLGIEAAFIVLFFFLVLFAQTTIIIIASSYYRDNNNLSLTQLILNISRTWTRPFVTSLYIQLLGLGYTSLFFLPFLVPSLVLYDHPTILITVIVLLAIPFIAFYLYLSVVWCLAVVVSVVEEDSYGFSALAKARELVKNNKRVHGFVLNLFFVVVLMVILMIGSKLSPTMPIIVGVIEVGLVYVVSMFQYMAYTVLYFQCSNNMKINNSGGLAYSQIPIVPNVDEDLA